MRRILEFGAKIDDVNVRPQQQRLDRGRLPDLLIRFGENPGLVLRCAGPAPLHIAVDKNHPAVVKLLLAGFWCRSKRAGLTIWGRHRCSMRRGAEKLRQTCEAAGEG